MAYVFDFENNLIEIMSPQTTVDIQDLINAIRTAEATEVGVGYDKIADASGKESRGGGITSGITVKLLNWQLHFWPGDYTATISGGNLVGGVSNDTVAYSAGVQVIMLQAIDSTIVTVSTGSGLSTEEHDALMAVPAASQNADALLDRSNAIETGLTLRGALRLLAAALAGKLSGAATDTVIIKNAVVGNKARITATVDADGNRTAVTTDVS